MSPPSKKQKLTNGTHMNGDVNSVPDPLAPATAQEKAEWRGFCEIESNPASFNAILRDLGISGVAVREIYTLDPAELNELPKPVHGLIFLYRYRPDSDALQETVCPDNVWFANQISDNSCATVSLLNIINNIPGVGLGEHLKSFRDFTQDLTPVLRGNAIANFDFVKSVHNSFARKMDMLNNDLAMRNQYDARNKPQKKAAPPKPKPKKVFKASKDQDTHVTEDDFGDENDDGFHFSAYVPVEDEIWKLDGLDRQPRRVGQFNSAVDDWMEIVTPIVANQMSDYAAGGCIQFNLLAFVRDPTANYKDDLARNIKKIRLVQAQLGESNPDWRDSGCDMPTAGDADQMLAISEDMIDAATAETIAPSPGQSLIAIRQALVIEQKTLRGEILKALEQESTDQEEARQMKNDYGPVIRTWLTMLAEKEVVMKELLQETV